MPDPTPRVLVDGFSNAAIQWQRAEARRQEQWHRKQRNDIRRQLLDRDPTYFGRKRRARRARGRRSQEALPYLGGHIWLAGFESKARAAFMDPRLGEPWPEEQAND